MTIYDALIQPFVEYGVLRRTLAACLALSASGAPLGVFLMLRRMAMLGDAMSHAILPGVAIAFVMAGESVPAMTLGGLAAGLVVSLVAGSVTRLTALKEDASFTAVFLISLALGVCIMTAKGGDTDLVDALFGNISAMGDDALLRAMTMSTVSLLVFAVIYRHLIVECFDPGFLKVAGGRGALVHHVFLALVVLNLVGAFQALGTLMALGLIMLPAIAARFWTDDIDRLMGVSVVLAAVASYAGLLLSHHLKLPAGPAVVLTAGALYIFSLLFGRAGGVIRRFIHPRHFAE